MIDPPDEIPGSRAPAAAGLIERLTKIRPGEGGLVLLSSLYFFCLLGGYYVLRPLREAMGLTGGVRDLRGLFLVTLGIMLVVNPIFAVLVGRYRRRAFIPVVYLFFAANLLVFFLVFRITRATADIWTARAFYVWVSVFNLFVVSVFWSFMVDLFDTEQSKRLFGLIGIGGTLGAIAGSKTVQWLAERLGEINLLPISIAMLLAACGCVLMLNRLVAGSRTDRPLKPAEPRRRHDDELIRGGTLSGLTHVARSPYLLGIAAYLALYSVTSTFAYFLQGQIVVDAVPDRGERTALFALINDRTNMLVLFVQIFFTGRIISRIGVGLTLAILPAITMIGFIAMILDPTLAMLIAFQVCRRGSNFALAKPARESLFTVLSREDRYKSKNFLDTFVHRAGDAYGALVDGVFLRTGTQALGGAIALAAKLAVPACAIWLAFAIVLGRRQKTMSARARPGDR